jgi:hypothetical protein
METLDRHFRDLTKAAFERYGHAFAELIMRWPEIAGPDVAAIAEPEKIRWPRAHDGSRRQGGTLVVRAAAGRALDISYAAPLLIERINRFFGYGAIAAVKAVQSASPPALPRKKSRPARPESAGGAENEVAGIADPGLRQALLRLAAARQNADGSPQEK